MNIVIVDPDQEEERLLADVLGRHYDAAKVHCFNDPLMALKFCTYNSVDCLYTTVSMKRLNGFELGKMLRQQQPKMELHLIADDERAKKDAMRIMADSYITRPVTADAIRLAEAADW